jgi:cellulose synthase/poly-beta-1,6-N-acetylglucosamine synthase-like glycosyltransferase
MHSTLKTSANVMPIEAAQAAYAGFEIAVILPCYNEEAAIADVVAGFRKVLPQAKVYVYDNNSKDRTSERAAAAGAIVRSETLQGRATWCAACSPTSTPTST